MNGFPISISVKCKRFFKASSNVLIIISCVVYCVFCSWRQVWRLASAGDRRLGRLIQSIIWQGDTWNLESGFAPPICPTVYRYKYEYRKNLKGSQVAKSSTIANRIANRKDQCPRSSGHHDTQFDTPR